MNPPRILIVDDIYSNRVLLINLIKKTKYEYVEAGNGEEAIEIIKSQPIDLVLLDIEMPVMNGIETIHYIRNEFSFPLNAIPVIALTAHDPKQFFDDYSDAGFDELYAKPYSLEKLVKKIEEILPG